MFAVCWLVSRQCRMIGSNIMKASGFPTGDLHPIRSRPCWAYTLGSATPGKPYVQNDMGGESGRCIGFIEECHDELHTKIRFRSMLNT